MKNRKPKLQQVRKEPLFSRHSLVASQHWKHRSNVLNLLKVNNKDIKKMLF